MIREMENNELEAVLRAGEWVVRDDAGGVWSPDFDTQVEIQCAEDPYAYAVKVCVARPMSGTWHS